ncbi:MAG: hypothetical protein ACRD2S_04145, partial [Terriglobales bacterium]
LEVKNHMVCYAVPMRELYRISISDQPTVKRAQDKETALYAFLIANPNLGGICRVPLGNAGRADYSREQ